MPPDAAVRRRPHTQTRFGNTNQSSSQRRAVRRVRFGWTTMAISVKIESACIVIQSFQSVSWSVSQSVCRSVGRPVSVFSAARILVQYLQHSSNDTITIFLNGGPRVCTRGVWSSSHVEIVAKCRCYLMCLNLYASYKLMAV